MMYKLGLFLLLAAFAACGSKTEVLVSYNHKQIAYEGRIDTNSMQAAALYWSGTSIKINFEGESIQALMQDETGNNYYNVIVDGDSVYLFRPGTKKQYYELTPKLASGKHSVELFKRTEWDRGVSHFYGFQLNAGAKLLDKAAPKRRKIEFYGNSITAGYAVEDFSGKDSPDSTFTNNYLSYSSLIARHYNAQYHCICKSGIGIMISWFPIIMPEIYDRINPQDSNSRWDFSLYTPDVVVVNLMQNDSWLVNMPEREEFKQNFGEKAPDEKQIIASYQAFISNIRTQYASAKIICALGNMDATRENSPWMDYVKQAVSNLNDDQIYTHFVAFKETPGHPSIAEQQIMADSFIQFIDANISW